MAKNQVTMVRCPVPQHEGEPVHTQTVLGKDNTGAFLLECTVCGAIEVPVRNEVYRDREAFYAGEPLDVKKMYPSSRAR